MLHVFNASIEQIFALAVQHHQAGRLREAEAGYRQILAQKPQHADALHLLGVMASQTDRHDLAIEMIDRAIAIDPGFAAYHSNLGETFRRAGQFERAIPCCYRALELNPAFVDAYMNLGSALLALGRVDEAREVFAKGIGQCPAAAVLHRHLGDTYVRLLQHDPAVACYQNGLRLDPRLDKAQLHLGHALMALGRAQEAVAAYAAALAPEDLPGRMHLAQALVAAGRPSEAIEALLSLLQRNPLHMPAMEDLAYLYRCAGRADDALRLYQRALEIKPGDASVTTNLAFALRDNGQLNESLKLLHDSVQANPTDPGCHSALIFGMHMDSNTDQAALEMEKERWNHFHAEPLAGEIVAHANDRRPERRLKIGYVSADFRQHPVGRFMMPLIANHDRAQYEVFCYSAARQCDATTRALQSSADQWRPVAALEDKEIAALVRRDGIDILVDLGMHCSDNRLPVFACKPAPVQITYLAYSGGTGLHAMDYRLTDRHINPGSTPPDGVPQAMEEAEKTFERNLFIETYWCYAPPVRACEVAVLPVKACGYVTFGSFNYFSKVNPAVLDAWIRLLAALPASRLILHGPGKDLWSEVHAYFEKGGVASSRVQLVPTVAEDKYFQQYGLVDVALDTFPFTGGTTTCDALWMGVPVVTLAGNSTISRGSTSILSTIGLAEFIADSWEDYHRVAWDLAMDVDRLERQRKTLRQRMLASPLMDAPRFARSVEQAYRRAWRARCECPSADQGNRQ